MIKRSIYFTNHLDNKKKIDDFIVDVEDSILEISNKKIYNTFTFTTNKVYYDPTIIGDDIERIEFKFKINDNDVKSFYFVIDSIEYLTNNNIKVYAKSKSYKYTKGKINKIIQATSVKNLIETLLSDITLNFDNLTDIPLEFDYTIEDKTIDEAINDLSKITDFDYYFYNGVLYFEDKKVIKKDDTAIITFRDIEDIEEFNTSTNKDEIKINKIFINEKKERVILSEPQIILDINDSPQCCSPDEVKIYIDSQGNKYKMKPINTIYTLYFSPTTKIPTFNLKNEDEIEDKIVVEKFKLQNDNFVVLNGGIDELIEVAGVENYTYKKHHNVLAFDYIEKGELKISYKTKVFNGVVEHSKFPKDVLFLAKHFNQILNFIHKIQINGYCPIPYTYTISLIKDWGIDSNEALGREVSSPFGTLISDNFGDITFKIQKYGTFKFETDGYEPLYLDWYINKKELYMDEINE